MKKGILLIAALFFSLAYCKSVPAQTLAFTYQGSLKSNGAPANGNFDMTFTLFDADSGGSQVGLAFTRSNVPVVNGVFSVLLNFGNQFQSGALRFLEISVRPSGSGAAPTTLAPRQVITSVPYAIKSLDTETLGGVPAANYVLSGATAINAATAYNIGGSRVLSIGGTGNLFAGVGAGGVNTGSSNAFFGADAGGANQSGTSNSFFGRLAGSATTSGDENAFFGRSAGNTNTTGSRNTLFGSNSDVGAVGLTNATAVGNRALVSQSNSLILGSINSVNGATANTNVGIGTTAPINRLTIGQPETPLLSAAVGLFNAGGIFMTVRDTTDDIEGLFGADANGVIIGSMSSSVVRVRTNNVNRITILDGFVTVLNDVQLNSVPAGNGTNLCINSGNFVVRCSSSLGFQTNVKDFNSGLDITRKLRPVLFNWKTDGSADMGLVAKEVARVEPLLITKNEKGEVEGIKYDRVGVVLVSAVNEQQAQIESLENEVKSQAETIKNLKSEIEVLKTLVCSQNSSAEICKPKN